MNFSFLLVVFLLRGNLCKLRTTSLRQAYGDDWASDEQLEQYAAALKPCAYDDFCDTAKELMTHETRSKVRKMTEFKFTHGPRLAIGEKRLRMVGEQIRKRAQMLLG